MRPPTKGTSTMSFKAASFAMAATIFSISVPAVPAHAARNIASVLAELDRGFDHQIFASVLGGLNRFPDSMIPFAAEEYRG